MPTSPSGFCTHEADFAALEREVEEHVRRRHLRLLLDAEPLLLLRERLHLALPALDVKAGLRARQAGRGRARVRSLRADGSDRAGE